MRKNELIIKAQRIPSLGNGGNIIGNYLIYYAEKVLGGQCIVEVGPWMGSSTAYLSIGSMFGNNAPIYTFDKWEADSEYIEKAKKYNGINVKLGQDLFPLFHENMDGFKNIYPEKKDLFGIEWNHNRKIGMLVLDMGNGKEKTDYALKTFLPHCIVGQTIVFFMDYYFYETHKDLALGYQMRLLHENYYTFEYLTRPLRSRTMIARYRNERINYDVN